MKAPKPSESLGFPSLVNSSDVKFNIAVPKYASKTLRSLLQSSVPMLVSLYQKQVFFEVKSFVLSHNHLIGLVLVSVEDKRLP